MTAGFGLMRVGMLVVGWCVGLVMTIAGFFTAKTVTRSDEGINRHHGLLLAKGFLRQGVRIRAYYTDQATLVQRVMGNIEH